MLSLSWLYALDFVSALVQVRDRRRDSAYTLGDALIPIPVK